MSIHQEEKERVLPLRAIFGFVWQRWKKYPLQVIGVMFSLIGLTTADLLFPVFAGKMVDIVAAKGEQMEAWQALVLLVGAGAIYAAFRLANLRFMDWAIIAAMRDIARQTFARVQRFSTDWHQNSFAGSTVRKITRGMWAFDGLIGTMVMGLIPSLIIVTGMVFVIGSRWPIMGVAVAIAVVLFGIASITLSLKYVAPANRAAVAKDTHLTAVLADNISCNAVVKSFGSEGREDANLAREMDEWWTVTQRNWWRMHNTVTIQSALMICLQIGLLGSGLWMWSSGQADAGDVVFLLTSYMIINGWLRNIGEQVRNLQKGINDIEDVVEFWEMVPEVKDREGAVPLKVDQGQVVFDKVDFAYENQDSKIYDQLNLTIAPGEKIGLVGHSGSGKSTFVKLLQRLYDVTGGAVKIDGQNIADVCQESLRQQVALVPQDPVLFHRTLADNIAYGRPGATREEIIDAAIKAHAHEFISRLPEGYDTLVGERGVKLSGGERQRVAIARAMLADRPILILDEATSSLDSVSEALIQEAIDRLTEGRTTIIVAHRLSTVQNVDRILVFDHGEIIEQGTHAELIRRDNGQYRALFEKQALGLIGDDMDLFAMAAE